MDSLIEFLGRYFSTESIQKSTDLFAAGLVNSLFSMQLLMFLEKEYGITVTNKDINIDNFCSIQAIENYIKCKTELHRSGIKNDR